MQLDLEKLFLLSVSNENLEFRGKIKHFDFMFFVMFVYLFIFVMLFSYAIKNTFSRGAGGLLFRLMGDCFVFFCRCFGDAFPSPSRFVNLWRTVFVRGAGELVFLFRFGCQKGLRQKTTTKKGARVFLQLSP